MDPWYWLAVFILVAYTIEAVTGFGSIVIALALGALLLPITTIMPVLVALNVCLTTYMVIRHHSHIHWPTLLKLILPLMVLGTLAGYGLRPWLSEFAMRLLFGVLVTGFAGRELWRAWRGIVSRRHGAGWTRGWMFGAGITHGLFASGGPLLVYALSGIHLAKAAFRATLVAVWLCLNSLLTMVFLLDGSLLPALPRVAAFLPLLLVGVLLGEWLHHRIDEARFRQLVFFLLFVTGILLLTGIGPTPPVTSEVAM